MDRRDFSNRILAQVYRNPYKEHASERLDPLGRANLTHETTMHEAAIDLEPSFTQVKHCRRCKRMKPVIAFYSDKSRVDGLQKDCICCRKETKGVFARLKAKAEMRRDIQQAMHEAAERDRQFKIAWQRIRNPIDESWHQRMAQVEKDSKAISDARRRERVKERRTANPEYFKAKQARYQAKHSGKVNARSRAWAALNRPKVNERQRRFLERKADCPLFNLAKRIRTTTRSAFKRKKLKKNNLTIEMVGCTWEILKSHIQKQFTKGMGWHNMKEWHIDHIVPLASARDGDELMRLAHFSNLRPMWAADNMAKGDSIVTCQPELALSLG